MVNTEKRFRSPWSAPGKNTVDDRNYVATAHQDRHGIETMIDSCHRFTYFQPVSIFLPNKTGFPPILVLLPTTCTLAMLCSPITPGQLPTLFVHNFLPSALSAVYLFLRNDFLTTLPTSLFDYKMFYFTPALILLEGCLFFRITTTDLKQWRCI